MVLLLCPQFLEWNPFVVLRCMPSLFRTRIWLLERRSLSWVVGRVPLTLRSLLPKLQRVLLCSFGRLIGRCPDICWILFHSSGVRILALVTPPCQCTTISVSLQRSFTVWPHP